MEEIMSYKEQKTITQLVTSSVVFAAYCIHAFGQYQARAVAEGDLRFWAITMLTFIGIGIVASIVILIVFHILHSIGISIREKVLDHDRGEKEIETAIKSEMVEDEMDKLIELKSNRIGFFLAGIGFVASLVSLAMNQSPVVMLNIIFISFFAGSLLEGGAQLYYYRRGI
jgi:hypothetical protein